MMRFFSAILPIICIVIYTSGGISKLNLKTQRMIMRLVRDISRYKARKRLQSSQDYSLVPLLLGQDSLRESQVLDDLIKNDDKIEIISRKELAWAKGAGDDDDLWIAVLGHVFDVKKGSKFYAKGGPYEMLAGRDATKALASGDLTVARDFENDDSMDRGDMEEQSLENDEMAEAKRWLEYFAAHQKYKHIGRLLRADDLVVNIDDLVGSAIELENSEDSEDEDVEEEESVAKTPPKWHPPVQDDNTTCPGGGN